MAQSKVESKQSLSTNNVIAVAAVASLVVVLVTVFVAKNMIDRVMFNNRVIAKKSAASTQLESNVKAVETLIGKYNDLGTRIQLVNDALPNKADFPTLVAMTESIAGASGVRLKSVTPAVAPGPALVSTTTQSATPAVTPAVVAPVPFIYSVLASGNYDSMMKFLANLELSSRPIKVLSIVHTGASTDQTLDIRLQTYYQPAADISLKKEVVK